MFSSALIVLSLSFVILFLSAQVSSSGMARSGSFLVPFNQQQTAPATWGVAAKQSESASPPQNTVSRKLQRKDKCLPMEVPLMVLVAVVLPIQAERMSTPGARISTTAAVSAYAWRNRTNGKPTLPKTHPGSSLVLDARGTNGNSKRLSSWRLIMGRYLRQ
jgi:hypothetical protein